MLLLIWVNATITPSCIIHDETQALWNWQGTSIYYWTSLSSDLLHRLIVNISMCVHSDMLTEQTFSQERADFFCNFAFIGVKTLTCVLIFLNLTIFIRDHLSQIIPRSHDGSIFFPACPCPNGHSPLAFKQSEGRDNHDAHCYKRLSSVSAMIESHFSWHEINESKSDWQACSV